MMSLISILMLFFLFQYYRKARRLAIHRIHPEIMPEEEVDEKLQIKYPKPFSEPPSPYLSRSSTPAPSTHGSDEDSSDDDYYN